jgi:hypothetical protein
MVRKICLLELFPDLLQECCHSIAPPAVVKGIEMGEKEIVFKARIAVGGKEGGIKTKTGPGKGPSCCFAIFLIYLKPILMTN